jgi:hypothetical protein
VEGSRSPGSYAIPRNDATAAITFFVRYILLSPSFDLGEDLGAEALPAGAVHCDPPWKLSSPYWLRLERAYFRRR